MRRRVLDARARQSISERRAFDDARQRLVLQLLDELAAPTLSIYLSQPPEPDTLALAARLHRAGWRIIVPSPGSGVRPWAEPSWAWYSEPLRTTPRGIPVPDDLSPADLTAADVIIMPGLAGSLDGARLGYGGGWYDRALASVGARAPRWLLLNDAELLDDVPRSAHDQPVDLIVTPGGVHHCR